MSEQPKADDSIETRTVENELLTLLGGDDWNREDLLNMTSENMNVPVTIVELGLERLLNRGECYAVEGVIKKT